MLNKTQNFVIGYVKTPPIPADSGTSLVVDAQYADNYPDPAAFGEYYLTVADSGNIPTPDNSEIILVTAKEAIGGGTWTSGTDCQLTIQRVAEGTENRSIVIKDLLYQSPTAAHMNTILKLLTDKGYQDISTSLIMDTDVDTGNPGGRFDATITEDSAFGFNTVDGDIWTLDLIITSGTPTFTGATTYGIDNLLADGSVNTLTFKNRNGIIEGFVISKD